MSTSGDPRKGVYDWLGVLDTVRTVRKDDDDEDDLEYNAKSHNAATFTNVIPQIALNLGLGDQGFAPREVPPRARPLCRLKRPPKVDGGEAAGVAYGALRFPNVGAATADHTVPVDFVAPCAHHTRQSHLDGLGVLPEQRGLLDSRTGAGTH